MKKDLLTDKKNQGPLLTVSLCFNLYGVVMEIYLLTFKLLLFHLHFSFNSFTFDWEKTPSAAVLTLCALCVRITGNILVLLKVQYFIAYGQCNVIEIQNSTKK